MKILSFYTTISLLIAAQAPARADPAQTEMLIQTVQTAARRWRSACTDKASDESCIVARVQTKQNRCQERVEIFTLGRRSARTARSAHKALVLALDTLSREPQVESVQAIVAEARYLVGEAAFADFLAIKAPEGLNFDDRNAKRSQRSQKAFLDFVARAQSTAREASEAFAEVATLPKNRASQPWRIASMAQQARMYRQYAGLFYGMEIPRDVRTGPYAKEATDAFCDALAEKAAPLEELAIQSADACVAFSQSTNSPWTARCQDLQEPIGVVAPK